MKRIGRTGDLRPRMSARRADGGRHRSADDGT
jgi:hypothetical protein